jgi:predicted permease
MPPSSDQSLGNEPETGSRWTNDLRARLSRLQLTPTREADILEELSQHLDQRYDELRAAGAGDAEARRMIVAELDDAGGLRQRMQALSQASAPPRIVPGQPAAGPLVGSWQDVRQALRAGRMRPGFTVAVIVTLALGIAVNTTVFTLVNGALLRPRPFVSPERLVSLSMLNVGDAENPRTGLSYLDLRDWQLARGTFVSIGATQEGGASVSGDNRAAAFVNAAYVSWNIFEMLGQQPALGREFRDADDRAGAPPVVILGGNLWRARYGADPTIVGRTVRVSGIPSTIVGVMPPEFAFPYEAELWLPLAALPEATREARDARGLDGYGRLRPDVTVERATAELFAITAALAEQYPDTNQNTGAVVEPLARIAPPLVAVMVALLGAVGFVLLIACANVANLLLARAADRSRDVVLRVALGASRWRILRQLLIESVLLAAAGGIGGLALSHAGIRILTRNIMQSDAAPPYWMRFPLDWTVLGYLVMLCAGTALACGLVPAWHAARITLSAGMNEAGRGGAGRTSRWTGAFVVAQVALALVLLTGATLMMQNLIGLVRTDVGVETDGLVQMTIDLRRPDDTPERRRLFLGQLEERLASRPDVEAALSSNAPMTGALVGRLRIEGRPAADPERLPLVSEVRVGPRYFAVARAPVVSGRVFTAGDLRASGDGVVVNERLVRMYFEHAPAVGARILLEPQDAPAGDAAAPRWMTVVGVVGNIRQRLLPSGEFDPVVYRTYADDSPAAVQVVVRSAAGPAQAAAFVRDQVRTLDSDLPVFGLSTVDEALAGQLWPQRLFGSMFAVFAGIAMVLAAGGLYAVTAYAVSRRTREIGVRMALGADAKHVWWTVTGTTFKQLAVGLVVGTAGAAAVASVLPAILVGSRPWNLLVWAGAILMLVTAAAVASAIPARRAVRLDPVASLRAD